MEIDFIGYFLNCEKYFAMVLKLYSIKLMYHKLAINFLELIF